MLEDHTVVPLRFRDIRAVYHLEQDIFPYDAYPYLDLALMLLTPGMVNLKAVDAAGELLGFIAVADAWLRWRPAWIITLGVARAYQNRGIGSALLAASEKRLRANRVRLTVRQSNHPAVNLYQKAAYTVLHTIPGYYRNGEAGLVMEKQL